MSDIEQKPKRVMTDEQKAKMKAGREAAKARKDAEKAAAAAPAPEPEAAPAPAPAPAPEAVPETPKKKAKKEKKAPDAPKKEKIAEAAPEPKAEAQPLISLVMNLKNDNWDEGDDDSEKWFQDRTYFASPDALRRYLTDRVYNWTDDFAVMFRGLADDSKTEINKMIETIVSSPFLANHAFNEVFNVSRCNMTIHQ